MILTEANYFGQKAAEQFMSASQLKRFLECEALAIAELRGAHPRETTTAMLVGSYVDAHFSGFGEQFVANNPEIFTKTGTLRAEFRGAQDIIDHIEADPLLMRMLAGEQQKVVTGEIYGVPFKGKIDSLLSADQCRAIAEEYPELAEDLLLADGAIVDLKIMRDLAPVWAGSRGKLGFAEAWRYDLQLAIYQQLTGGKMPCYIAAATKEKTPDKALIRMPQYMMDLALKSVEEAIPYFHSLKSHPEDAKRCGTCDWCRKTKVLTGAVDADGMGEDWEW